jgi:hypothetical protein
MKQINNTLQLAAGSVSKACFGVHTRDSHQTDELVAIFMLNLQLNFYPL